MCRFIDPRDFGDTATGVVRVSVLVNLLLRSSVAEPPFTRTEVTLFAHGGKTMKFERLIIAGAVVGSFAVPGCGGGSSGGSNNSDPEESAPDVLERNEVDEYVISRVNEPEMGTVDDVILKGGVSNKENDIEAISCSIYGEHEGVSNTGNDYTLGICFTSPASGVTESDIYSPVASKRIDVIAPLIEEPTQDELADWVDEVKDSKPSIVYGVDEDKTLQEQYGLEDVLNYRTNETFDLKLPYRVFNGDPTSAEYQIFDRSGDSVDRGNLSVDNGYVEVSINLFYNDVKAEEEYITQVESYFNSVESASVNAQKFETECPDGFTPDENGNCI